MAGKELDGALTHHSASSYLQIQKLLKKLIYSRRELLAIYWSVFHQAK